MLWAAPSARRNATGEGLRKEEFVGEFGARWDKAEYSRQKQFLHRHGDFKKSHILCG